MPRKRDSPSNHTRPYAAAMPWCSCDPERCGADRDLPGGIFALDITLHCNVFNQTMKLEKELVAASSVPLVLSILSEGDSYGYAIIQRVKELSGGKIEWTDGMLYPVLHWLEDQDLVASRWVDSDTGRQRKYYSLKARGRK